MFVYVLLILMATAFACLEMVYPASERLKRWMISVSAFTMTILAGFRKEIGGDWIAYYQYHIDATHTPFRAHLQTNDPGYTSINWILARLGLDVWSINLVCAFLLVWGITALASTLRYRNLFFLSAIPYLLLVVGMGYSRQSAAIGLICLSIYFSFKARRHVSGLFALASLFFHKSAAFGIMPIILVYSRQKWKTILIAAVSAPLLAVVVVLQAYENVQKEFIEASYSSSGAFIRVAQIFLCGIWFFLFLRAREFENRRPLLTILATFSVLAMLGLAVSPSSTLIDRLALYLLPFQCYVLAKTPEAFLQGSNRTLAYLAVIGINLAIFGVWMTTSDNLDSWIPYQNYLWSGSH